MEIEYEIEHYGAVEFTEDMIRKELGLKSLATERLIIKIGDAKLYISLRQVCDETYSAFGKLIRLTLEYSDAAVVIKRGYLGSGSNAE